MDPQQDALPQTPQHRTKASLKGLGIRCRRCGSAASRVYYVRRHPSLILRQRHCLDCGYAQRTVEIVHPQE